MATRCLHILNLKDEPGAYRSRCVRLVPEENRARDDGRLSPLRGQQGHSAAHAGVLPGVGAAPLHPASRHRREIGPFGGRGSDAEQTTGVRGCPLLLRTSDARKGAGRKV